VTEPSEPQRTPASARDADADAESETEKNQDEHADKPHA
jgi:ribonuclease E